MMRSAWETSPILIETIPSSRDLGPDDPRLTQVITDNDIKDPREPVGKVFIIDQKGIEKRAEVKKKMETITS